MKTPPLLMLMLVGTLPGMLYAEEERMVLFPSNTPKKPLLLAPGEHVDAAVSFGDKGAPTHKYLRVVGGAVMPAPFAERGEENFRRQEYCIDDSLDAVNVDSDKYSLYFKGNNEEFERKAYYRVNGEMLHAGPVSISAKVKRTGFSVVDSADFGVQMELFFQKEGRSKHDVYDTPDALLFMPISGGDGPFTEISQSFTLPENVVAAVVVMGGRRFSGACWVEAPRLTQDGHAVADIPFVKNTERSDDFNYWVGCNLVTRFWPTWKVTFNGEALFEGAVFDRASNVADFFVPLPDSLKGTGTLRLELVKDPVRANFPYEVRSVEIIETPARDFEIIHSPEFIAKGRAFGLLVETNRADVRLAVTGSDSVAPDQTEVLYKESGLHVLKFQALKEDAQPAITVSDGVRTETLPLGQIVEKGDDGVFLSVGDDIYTDKNDPHFAEYFKWYVGQRMGSLYQFRPSYQWSGFRKPDLPSLQRYLGLMQDLQMPYVWQVEGRTLASKDMNPSVEVLNSPLFHGKQAHENDGGYYYWQHFKYLGFFSDMAARTRPYGGIFAKHPPIYTDQGTFIHYDPNGVTDMAAGAQQLVENFRYSKGESTRHTGPSTLFRYLYQAGYDWLGAEQMYGPEETIMSALRGASRAYHKDKYGSLHAMQWGSFPYTDPKHAQRFFLSLAVAYMHGSSHMNTEDGLWLDEYAHDRFSEAGQRHIAVQHKVLDFIQTHERRGDLVANAAVIQGRNDGWKSFVRGPVWSQNGEKWSFNKACESFDLLRVFYPQDKIDASGPEGWFTSTPYGAVDLAPIEADQAVLNRYTTIIFLGWNSYNEADFVRLKAFVEQGGTLILSAAHVNDELAPDKTPRFPANDGAVRALLGDDYQQLTGKTVRTLGRGQVVYFPSPLYPAENALAGEYAQAMRDAAETANQGQEEYGWVVPGDKIGFTVWDKDNRRTIYLLNIDWKSGAASQTAEFLFGKSSFHVAARLGALETIHCADGMAAMPQSNTTDILEIAKQGGGWQVTVQITEPDEISLFNAATGATRKERLTEPGIHKVVIE